MCREKRWSPLKAGIIIGLLQVPAFLIVKTGLGLSTSYVTFVAYVSQYVGFDVEKYSYFTKLIGPMKYVWQLSMLIGIIFGAFISSRLSGMARSGISKIWEKDFGIKSKIVRYIMAFLGGYFMILGARIASGCTSGHGITGTAQFATGSLITLAMLFIFGVITVMLFRKKRSN